MICGCPPVAGRRAPADHGQILDAPRYGLGQRILRQNEKTRLCGPSLEPVSIVSSLILELAPSSLSISQRSNSKSEMPRGKSRTGRSPLFLAKNSELTTSPWTPIADLN